MAFLDFIKNSKTPAQKLEDAVRYNNVSELDHLIQGGIDPNLILQKHGGNTALHVAAWHGNYLCISKLIEAGARCEITNDSDITPLCNAARSKHHRALQVLLKHSPNVLGLETLWQQRLWSEILFNPNIGEDVLRVLVVATPDMNTVATSLSSHVFQLCKRNNSFQILKILIESGCKATEMKQIANTISQGVAAEVGEEQRTNFRSWLDDFKKNPQTLKCCCRMTIRVSMHDNCNVFYGSTRLPLPRILQDFLCFS